MDTFQNYFKKQVADYVQAFLKLKNLQNYYICLWMHIFVAVHKIIQIIEEIQILLIKVIAYEEGHTRQFNQEYAFKM